MYYPCSENKGADQLRGYREADLRLCFRLGKNPVFSRCGSNTFLLYIQAVSLAGSDTSCFLTLSNSSSAPPLEHKQNNKRCIMRKQADADQLCSYCASDSTVFAKSADLSVKTSKI